MRDNFRFGAAQLAIPSTDVLKQNNESAISYEIHKPNPTAKQTQMTIQYDFRDDYTWTPSLLFAFLSQNNVNSHYKRESSFKNFSMQTGVATSDVEYDDFDKLVRLIRKYYDTEANASQGQIVSTDFDEETANGWGLKYRIS